MPRAKLKLPPIAVEDHSEKISLSLPLDLRHEIDRFGEFFCAGTGTEADVFQCRRSRRDCGVSRQSRWLQEMVESQRSHARSRG
jgi:hypothetical protein